MTTSQRRGMADAESEEDGSASSSASRSDTGSDSSIACQAKYDMNGSTNPRMAPAMLNPPSQTWNRDQLNVSVFSRTKKMRAPRMPETRQTMPRSRMNGVGRASSRDLQMASEIPMIKDSIAMTPNPRISNPSSGISNRTTCNVTSERNYRDSGVFRRVPYRILTGLPGFSNDESFE